MCLGGNSVSGTAAWATGLTPDPTGRIVRFLTVIAHSTSEYRVRFRFMFSACSSHFSDRMADRHETLDKSWGPGASHEDALFGRYVSVPVWSRIVGLRDTVPSAPEPGKLPRRADKL